MRIGILSAMLVESRPIAAAINAGGGEPVAGTLVEHGISHGNDVFVCTFGVGGASAAAATQLLISQYRCSAIIIAGAAGNTDRSLPIGGVVIGKRLVYHDFDMEILSHYPPETAVYNSDDRGIAAAEAACRALYLPYIVGTVATGNEFVCDKRKAMEIAGRTGCSAVEMESAAAAQVAAKNKVPFLAIRVMSDNADEAVKELRTVREMPYESYAEECADIVMGIIKKLL